MMASPRPLPLNTLLLAPRVCSSGESTALLLRARRYSRSGNGRETSITGHRAFHFSRPGIGRPRPRWLHGGEREDTQDGQNASALGPTAERKTIDEEVGEFRRRVSDLKSRHTRRLDEIRRTAMEQQALSQLNKLMETDPYAMLFGGNLDRIMGRRQRAFDVVGGGAPAAKEKEDFTSKGKGEWPRKIKIDVEKSAGDGVSESKLEFDPISNRMVARTKTGPSSTTPPPIASEGTSVDANTDASVSGPMSAIERAKRRKNFLCSRYPFVSRSMDHQPAPTTGQPSMVEKPFQNSLSNHKNSRLSQVPESCSSHPQRSASEVDTLLPDDVRHRIREYRKDSQPAEETRHDAAQSATMKPLSEGTPCSDMNMANSNSTSKVTTVQSASKGSTEELGKTKGTLRGRGSPRDAALENGKVAHAQRPSSSRDDSATSDATGASTKPPGNSSKLVTVYKILHTDESNRILSTTISRKGGPPASECASPTLGQALESVDPSKLSLLLHQASVLMSAHGFEILSPQTHDAGNYGECQRLLTPGLDGSTGGGRAPFLILRRVLDGQQITIKPGTLRSGTKQSPHPLFQVATAISTPKPTPTPKGKVTASSAAVDAVIGSGDRGATQKPPKAHIANTGNSSSGSIDVADAAAAPPPAGARRSTFRRIVSTLIWLITAFMLVPVAVCFFYLAGRVMTYRDLGMVRDARYHEAMDMEVRRWTKELNRLAQQQQQQYAEWLGRSTDQMVRRGSATTDHHEKSWMGEWWSWLGGRR